jgi:hypothetical protein
MAIPGYRQANAVATAVPVVTADMFVSVDATAAVQNWITMPSSNNGFMIVANGSASIQFDSKENTATSHPATLTLVLVNTGPTGATGPTGLTGVGLQGATGPAGSSGPSGPGSTPTSSVIYGIPIGGGYGADTYGDLSNGPGATTVDPSIDTEVASTVIGASSTQHMSATYLISSLNSGSNTFTAKFGASNQSTPGGWRLYVFFSYDRRHAVLKGMFSYLARSCGAAPSASLPRSAGLPESAPRC